MNSKRFPGLRLFGVAVICGMIGVIGVLASGPVAPHHPQMTFGGLFLLVSIMLFIFWVPVAIWQLLWRSAGKHMEAGKRSA